MNNPQINQKIRATGTNLLEAIQTPFFTGVVDASHIGDEVRDMVRGHQGKQTVVLFDMFDFNAILLSAGVPLPRALFDLLHQALIGGAQFGSTLLDAVIQFESQLM